MTQTINIRVNTLTSDIDFAIQEKTTGKELFDQVARNLNIFEIWYFGIEYDDSNGESKWVKLKKPVLTREMIKNSPKPIKFRFRVRFYPEDVVEELAQETTLRLFYLQVKGLILTEKMYCPPETCVLLASYSSQIKYGDYNPSVHRPGVLLKDQLLPISITQEVRVSAAEWENRVIQWWKEHKGLDKEEATLEYLKVAQDLDMFGIQYFPISNKKDTSLFLGVGPSGISIYDKDDQLTPRVGFHWNEIKNVSYRDKKFILKPALPKAPDFNFYVSKVEVCKEILMVCMGNHELFKRRRNPEDPAIQRIRVAAKQERAARKEERERIRMEAERRQLDEQQREYMEKIQEDTKRSAELTQQEKKPPRTFLENDTEPIRIQNQQTGELEEKYRAVEEAERQLKHQQELLKAEEERRKREDKEKENLVLQIEKIRQDADEQAKDIQKKQEESCILEEELRETNTKLNKVQQQYNNHNYRSSIQSTHTNITNTAPITPSTNNREPEYVNRQQVSSDTHDDTIYRENKIDRGIDKYKTLKKIRTGTVKRRIDEFESM